MAWARGSSRPEDDPDFPVGDTKTTERRVLARPYVDTTDAAIFAVVIAGQRVNDEPWLVRATLRRRDTGAPLMQRITVEHLTDPSREVTGTIIREIPFATIRDEALKMLRQSAWSKARLADASASLAPLFTQDVVDQARAAAVEAAKGKPSLQPSYTTEHYRHIAIQRLLLNGTHRSGILAELCKRESDRLGEPIERERMRGWLAAATRMGYLLPGKRGARDRAPGPNIELKSG